MTTTTMTVPAPTHAVAVGSDGDEYQATCSCGWASEWHFTPDDADTAGAGHCESSVAAADHMDELMSGLLDLQDDIAAVVVWLAENWSTSLPVLGWSSSGDDRDLARPALRVLGYCQPAEMPAVGAVLGGLVADDPPTASGRDRYRRAIRDFGRVRIDVFTSLTGVLAAEDGPVTVEVRYAR